MQLHFKMTFHPQTDGQSEVNIQTMEDMLWICVLDFGGIFDMYLPLAEFSYINNYHTSIDRPPFEVLYGRKCHTSICEDEVELIRHVPGRLKIVRRRKKSYVDRHRLNLEVHVKGIVLLKVSPQKDVIRFRKRGKVGPRYICPFRAITRVCKVVFRLELPEELNQVHNTFHISYLRKCLVDESTMVSLEDIQVDHRMNYMQKPILILDKKTKTLQNKVVDLVKA